MPITRERVFESLDNAGINGYDFRGCEPEGVILDLQTYDADAEQCTEDELRPHVVAWLAEHPNGSVVVKVLNAGILARLTYDANGEAVILAAGPKRQRRADLSAIRLWMQSYASYLGVEVTVSGGS